ncbi:melatonin receptor type 1B-like [Lytechinus variegatus]|uniref:melatonin receptor type 1B-like n=1 Tax=Lytechinus variegatus TaxID=7654 RepID=UPI001BB1EA4E|nr:melatonin receptor type 1B-like [Lytechinus variegatus]
MASLDLQNITSSSNTVKSGVVSVFDGNEMHMTIISVLYIIITIVGMVGNIFVLVAVVLSRKLHTFTNVFVVNLSLFDFWTCFALPFQAVGIMATNGWPLPPAICTIISAMAIVTQSGSVMTLALIGINRYLHIVKPKEVYFKVYTHLKVGIMIGSTWLFPTLFLVGPQFIPGIGSLRYSEKFKVCLWDTNCKLAIIIQCTGAVVFIISTFIIIFCYSAIYLFIRKHFKDSNTSLQINLNPPGDEANYHFGGKLEVLAIFPQLRFGKIATSSWLMSDSLPINFTKSSSLNLTFPVPETHLQ